MFVWVSIPWTIALQWDWTAFFWYFSECLSHNPLLYSIYRSISARYWRNSIFVVLIKFKLEHVEIFLQPYNFVFFYLACRQRIKVLREKLIRCQTLLYCNRDDLKTHWQEGLECTEKLALLAKMYVLRYNFVCTLFGPLFRLIQLSFEILYHN